MVCSLRLLLAFLAFLGFFLCYAQRNGLSYEFYDYNKNWVFVLLFCLSVGIVCMVNPDADSVPLSNSSVSTVINRNIPVSCQKHKLQESRSVRIFSW